MALPYDNIEQNTPNINCAFRKNKQLPVNINLAKLVPLIVVNQYLQFTFFGKKTRYFQERLNRFVVTRMSISLLLLKSVYPSKH